MIPGLKTFRVRNWRKVKVEGVKDARIGTQNMMGIVLDRDSESGFKILAQVGENQN